MNALTERGGEIYNKLWHNYYDLFYAVIVYIFYCKLLNIKINLKAVAIVLKHLNKVPIIRTRNREGFLVVEYRNKHSWIGIP